jgi:hypothetical protein
LGHEFATQSFEFATNKSAEFAGSVCGLEKVTVAEPFVIAAVPDSCTPDR